MEKTLKREVAIGLLMWLLGIATFAFWQADLVVKVEIIKIFILPVFGFVAAAFGMDWLTKQTNLGGPPSGGAP